MPAPESTFKGLRLTQRASSSDVFAHAGGNFGLGSASATVQSTTVKLTYELLLQAGQELEVGPDNQLQVVNRSVGMRLFVTISDVQADFGLDLAGIRSKEVTKVDAAARGFQLLEATVLARELRRPNAITDLNIGFSTAPEVLRILGYNDEL